MAARRWTCRKCKKINLRIKQKCVDCGSKRPPARRPKHHVAFDMPYEEWVALFGEQCGICTRRPSATRRLDRDHWHNGDKAGEPRGLLCSRCNRALVTWMDIVWLGRAIEYLNLAHKR